MPRFAKTEFPGLYKEFIDSGYLESLDGVDHLSAYEQCRGEGRLNYRSVLEAREMGEDVTGPDPTRVAASRRHGGESGEGRVGTHRPCDPGRCQEGVRERALD